MLRESDLHEYQKYAVQHIIDHPRCGVFLDMGLGKTASTLTAINELMYRRREIKKVLVVAPKRVALHTWSDEIGKWEHLKHLTTSRVLGSKKQREEALQQEADIYIINIDNYIWLMQYLGMAWNFDMVVIDEFSMYKNSRTKRFKETKKHMRLHPRSRVVGLTGTPSPKSLEDLWSQLYVLDGGTRLGQYITHFRQRYFRPAWGNGHIVYKWSLLPGSEEAIYNKIGDICVSMKSEDYLTLPPVRYVEVPVSLDDKERKQYQSFQREKVLECIDGTCVTPANAAVLSNYLRQWTGGAVWTDRENGEYINVNTAKIERLKEMLEEINTPVIVAYEYGHELERLRKAFPKAKTIDEPGVFEAWNKGDVPILLGQPASMGHGLNLQKGGYTIIWYTTTWSLELYEQMNARLARQGQTHKVTIYHLVTEGTIDGSVVQALQRKEQVQNALMEAIKAIVG